MILLASDLQEHLFTLIDISYLFFISLKDLENPLSFSQYSHHPLYNLRNTLKRQEEAVAKPKVTAPKRTSPFSVGSAYNSVKEGVVGTFITKKSSPTVNDTPESSVGRPNETSTPASLCLRELVLSQSQLEDPTQASLHSQFPSATRKVSIRSSTSSAAGDGPTVNERIGAGDMYMDESRVFGQTDLLAGSRAQANPTLNFTTESEYVETVNHNHLSKENVRLQVQALHTMLQGIEARQRGTVNEHTEAEEDADRNLPSTSEV